MCIVNFDLIKDAHDSHGLSSRERIEAFVGILVKQGTSLTFPLDLDVRRRIGHEILSLVSDIIDDN